LLPFFGLLALFLAPMMGNTRAGKINRRELGTAPDLVFLRKNRQVEVLNGPKP
jgi:hypothetical protein